VKALIFHNGRFAEREIMRRILTFVVFFCLWCTPLLHAALVYLWTDNDGNMHITDQPPPAGAQQYDVLRYTPPRRIQNEGKRPAESDEPADEDSQIEQICRVAERARRIAGDAEDIAAAARTQAEKKRKEAEDFKERVGYDDDRLENFKDDIREREEAARRAEMFAEQAGVQAREAELQAKMAELEAGERCPKRNLF
jgi:hypothetical protein